MAGKWTHRGLMTIACAIAVASIATPAQADEMWVAPTSQQDFGGLGIGSNVFWPVTPVGIVRLAWGVPNNLQSFQGAKLALIPHAPSGAGTLNLIVCRAQNSDLVGAACTGPTPHAFAGVANHLLEIDVSAAVGAQVGTAGLNYVAVLAYTTPTTATDHILGLRFAYTPTSGSGGPGTTYLRQSAEVTTPLGQFGTATATCNPGDRVLGGGHNTGAADILVGRSYPDTVSSWTVSVKPTAVGIGWFAVAVCLDLP